MTKKEKNKLEKLANKNGALCGGVIKWDCNKCPIYDYCMTGNNQFDQVKKEAEAQRLLDEDLNKWIERSIKDYEVEAISKQGEPILFRFRKRKKVTRDRETPDETIKRVTNKYINNMKKEDPDLLFKADSQVNEWKPLEVDNLPSDILTGDYEFESWNGEVWKLLTYSALDHSEHEKRALILNNLIGYKYRYRKIQQEPSVEDMAEEYYKAECNKGIEAVLRNIVSGKADYPHAIKSGFIAGYNKAKENTDELKKQYNENVLI